MSKIRKQSRPRYKSAAEWPSTPEIDGFVWNLTKPVEDVPNAVWDERADLAQEQDRLDRGVRFF